jgi:hypothetical protein
MMHHHPRSRGAAALAVLFGLLLAHPAHAQTDPRLVDVLRIAQEGASDSARGIVTRLLQQTPPTDSVYPQMLYTMGLVSRSVDEMRRNYTRVAVEYTTSSWADDAIYRLALLDYASGNLPNAARQLDRIRNDYPDSPLLAPAAEWAARAFFEQKKVAEGCTWLALGLEHAGDDVELKNRLDYLNGRCSVQGPLVQGQTGTGQAGTPVPAADTVKPASAPVRSGFGVQVGAVNSQAAADKLAKDVKDAGFTAYVVKEGSLFKVRAGPYPDRAKALQAAEQVRRKLNRSPFVVKEP